jgi:HJR/Mrr/RecB family endonuclease
MINWTRVNPSEFEKFCAEILELNGFENLQWYGKGGADKARDIVATKMEAPLPGIRRTRTWVVQCKRYVRAKIGKQDINEFLIAAREHDPDAVLLIVTTTLTSGVRDWIEAVRKDYKFEIFTWEERDIEREFQRHGKKLSVKPPIIPQKEQPVLFYETNPIGRV